MARKLIDISIPLDNDTISDPEPFRPKITYMDHKKTTEQVCSFFPGLKPEDLPDGEGWAIEKIELTTHNGTHLDAPYHFATTMNRGERAITIDEVPLDWCFRPGVNLDFRHFEDGYVATAADVEAELNRIGHKIEPYDIVVGKEALRKAWKPWFANHGNFRFVEEETFIDEKEQKVLYRWLLKWPSFESGSKGRPEKRRGVDVIHFENGKIINKLTYSKTTIEIDGKRESLHL